MLTGYYLLMLSCALCKNCTNKNESFLNMGKGFYKTSQHRNDCREKSSSMHTFNFQFDQKLDLTSKEYSPTYNID